MLAVILGVSDIGVMIANQFISQNIDVTIIVGTEEESSAATSKIDAKFVVGNISNIETFRQANVDTADIFVAAKESEETNIIACLIVNREFNVKTKIARIKSTKFLEKSTKNILIDIDQIINPEIEAGKEIINAIEKGASSAVIKIKGNLEIRDLFINEHSFFLGRSYSEVLSNLDEDFKIIGVLRDEVLKYPSENLVFSHGDHVYIVAETKIFTRVFKKLGISNMKLKNIVIIGGGRVGKTVASNLSKKGLRVKVVDNDRDVCTNLYNRVPNITIIHGSASNKEIFDQLNIEEADAIITTTANEELNVLTAAYAKLIGTKRTVAIVTNPMYVKIANFSGVDTVVNPKKSAVDSVVRFIKQNAIIVDSSGVFNSDSDIVKFIINSSSKFLNKSFDDILVPRATVLVGVIRNKEVIFASSQDFNSSEILLNDEILFFATKTDTITLENSFIEE